MRSWFSLLFSASGIDPPGPAGYIEGTRPYFFSVGQSEGPIRSNPLQPSRAASRQQSSSDIFRSKTPRVTACLSRALRVTRVVPDVCANAVVPAAARLKMKSRRCMRRTSVCSNDTAERCEEILASFSGCESRGMFNQGVALASSLNPWVISVHPFGVRSIQHREHEQRVGSGDDQILCAVQFVGDRAIADGSAEVRMPQRFTASSIHSHEIACRISRKNQIAGCTQDAVMAAGSLPFVAPANFAGFVIDRLHHSFRKSASIVSAPALRLFIVIKDVVHAERSSTVDVKQTRVRTVARRMPICGSTLIRRDKNAIDLRLLRGIRNRLPFCIDSQRPIRSYELRRKQILAVGSIQQEEPAIAACLRKKLSSLSVEFTIDEHRSLHSVPVMGVVWRGLKIPRQLSCIRIKSDD